MGKLTKATIAKLRKVSEDLQARERCGQYPKGPLNSPCKKPLKRGWDTCGRPDCAAWKLAEDWED
jgi:hypothetical protein